MAVGGAAGGVAGETDPGADAGGPLPRAGFALLAGVTLFWGTNWPVLKIALFELPVWSFRTLCLLGGGLGLLALARLGGSIRVPGQQVGPLLVCALFNVLGWQLFSAYGVLLMPAGRASIIAYTMPVWAALLGFFVLGERLTATKLIGLGLGLVGLAVLMGADLGALGESPLGAVFMVLAALSWAAGTVLLKRYSWTIPTTVLAGWQVLAGALPVGIGAIAFEEISALGEVSLTAWVATAYIIALPTIFCHWAFMVVVRLFPAVVAAIGTIAIPVLGVFSSAWALGEPVGAREIVALVLVCAALAVVLVLPALRAPARQPSGEASHDGA